LDEMPDAKVGGVVEPRVQPAESGFPCKATLVCLMWMPRRARSNDHRARPHHDLDHVETLVDSVSRQLAEPTRPWQARVQPVPPGVAEPEERRTVGVRESPSADPQATMPIQRVVAIVRDCLELTRFSTAHHVTRLTTDLPPVNAGLRGGEPD